MRRIFLIFIACIVLILLFFIFNQEYRRFSFSRANVLMKIKLPTPIYHSKTSIEEALSHRRSIREYKNEALTLQDVGQLLWAVQGVTSKTGFRTAPSAGALYPLEVYLISGKVTNLDPGIYHYVPSEHSLEKTDSDDKRSELAKAAFNQHEVRNGVVDIVITANYKRTTTKYGERGIRFVHLEAGHAAENLCLQAVSLQLGTVTIGAFNDELVKKILNLKNEDPLYIMPVGKVR